MPRWLPIADTGYSISDEGTVRAEDERLVPPVFHFGKGRVSLELARIPAWEGSWPRLPLAELVARLFVSNPDPERYTFVAHKNLDRRDCRAVNLYWADFHLAGLSAAYVRQGHLPKLERFSPEDADYIVRCLAVPRPGPRAGRRP